jgi:hypothetical protein
MTKGNLLNAYKTHCNNQHLRRLAEAICNEISYFSGAPPTKNELTGDAYKRLLPLAIKDSEPFTAKEKAWANSFNQ